MENIQFKLSNKYTQPQLIDDLVNHFSLKKDSSVVEQRIFYDTFDWRLYDASLLLYHSCDALTLCRWGTDQPLQKLTIKQQPALIQHLPNGPLKAHLAPIINIRTLLKLVTVNLETQTCRILNADEKTVAWLILTTSRPEEAEIPPDITYISVKAVRGYDKQARSLTTYLKSLGLSPTHGDFFIDSLAAIDRSPGDYSNKPDVRLTPSMPANEATRRILRNLLETLKRNEAGVKQDIDTECLHDFRVAVRRTRSALGQIKFVFEDEATNHFKQAFAKVGKLTNDLRDLDVYLLAEESYKARLPDNLREYINPLFDYLRTRRGQALDKVVDGLNSAAYRRLINDWEDFLDSSAATAAKNSEVPIIKLAQRRMHKRYTRIVRWGERILANTIDEELHALRLECKKLRYLMEFFASLFPDDEINLLIKQLKKLQNNLGDFNDLCVQEEYLLALADKVPLSVDQSRHMFLAIGYLIGTLHQEREQVKGEFAHTFTGFTVPKNKALFRELFAPKKKVKS